MKNLSLKVISEVSTQEEPRDSYFHSYVLTANGVWIGNQIY